MNEKGRGFESNLTKREIAITQKIREIFRTEKAKGVKVMFEETGKKREIKVFGKISLNNRLSVLAKINEVLEKEGESFDHTMEDGFLVISLEKTEEEIAAREETLKSEIVEKIMEDTGIDMIPA